MPTHLNRSSVLLALALVCAQALALPALAQTPGQDDLQALRYYLQEDNQQAVRSEMRRLQLQFPEWTPPSDLSNLFETRGPENIDRIYRLIEAEDFDAARALIEETDSAFADWSPPSEMLALLNVSEAQHAFSAAVESSQPEVAVGIARGIPAILSCERINNAWDLGDMHLLLGDTSAALSVYRAVLRSCSAPEILIATLEKADAVASLDELTEYSDIAQAQAPAAEGRIRQVEDRLRAGRQVPARWGNGESVIALDAAGAATATATAPPVSADSPRPPPRPTVADAPSAPAAPTAAAPAAAPSAPAQPSQPARGVSAVQAAADRGAWAECLALSTGATQIAVIYQRGWCAYNADRTMEAIAAFREAAARGTSDIMRRDAQYGMMLSMLQLNMTEDVARLSANAPMTREQRVEIEGQILDQRGVRAYNNREYARAVSFFDAHAELTGIMRRDLQLLKGYALLNMGHREAARAIFTQLDRQLSTRDTRAAIEASF
ncbi:MAG: hypothetical protein JJU15_04950 [Pararhodobacter sp.]|nr:hypothetical protein [Pararhodobacter sp.]